MSGKVQSTYEIITFCCDISSWLEFRVLKCVDFISAYNIQLKTYIYI